MSTRDGGRGPAARTASRAVTVAVGAVAATLVLGGAPALAFTSTPDPGYGTAGTVTFPKAFPATLAADGERTLAMVMMESRRHSGNRLYRLAADGSVDPAYGGGRGWYGTRETTSWFSVVADRWGRAILAGVRYDRQASVPVVRRVTSDGTRDSGFGRDGVVRLGGRRLQPIGTAVDGRGRIDVLSLRSNGSGRRASYDSCVTRLRRNGTFDRRFGDAGTSCIDVADDEQAIALSVDGRDRVLVAGGGARRSPRSWVLRLRPDGHVDGGFGAHGVSWVRFGAKHQSAASSTTVVHGRIVVGAVLQASGKPLGSGGALQAAAFRLDANGSLDRSYAQQGRARLPMPTPKAVMFSILGGPDGSMVAIGETNGTDPEALVGALTPQGEPDTGIGPDGSAVVPGTGTGTFALSAALTPTRLLVMSARLSAATYASKVTALLRS